MLKSAAFTRVTRSLRAERGFTLVELMLSLALSIIVVGALLAILEVSLRQETSVSAQVQSNHTGRLALTKVIEELHSSCTGLNTLPVQAPSTTPTSPLTSANGTSLWFISAYGSKASGNAIINEVTEHNIAWKSEKTSNTGVSLGTLRDYSFAATGGEAPTWTFPTLTTANATTTVLATNVAAPSSGSLFRYYTYNTSGQLTEVAVPLTTTTAKTVAKVSIGFTQAPESGDTRAGRTVNLSDVALLRFGPSETGTEAENTPCS